MAVACMLALAGCIVARSPRALSGPDPLLVARATASAADQVKRCYRSPGRGSDARQIVTRLRVRYLPDGTLAQSPVVVSQTGVTPTNRPFAGAMAQAAILATMDCSPLRLPPELYSRGWEEFELTFSPPGFG